jgi:hypothetical protein
MTERGKIKAAIEWANQAVKNWRTVPLSELREACKYNDTAVLCLIHRMGQ